MKKLPDYTSNARMFAARHPLLNHVITQAVFWIITYGLLAFIITLTRWSLLSEISMTVNRELGPNIVLGFIIGTIYGSCLGVLDYISENRFFRNKPLGKLIAVKAVIAVVLLTFNFNLIRFVLFDAIVAPSLSRYDISPADTTWQYLYLILLVYSFFATLVINFTLQVNKKFGPGVLLPLLLGKYRNPKEEERIFLFMDLKSSTTIAESLGHFRYSAFIRDSFMDINNLLFPYNAEIYQYVGDEIVLSWKTEQGLRQLSCVHFFYACERQFKQRTDYYIRNYGQTPQFKAGLHMGKVTAVEIGEIKKDIAYHGDTINTTARIQSMCNECEKQFLISSFFLERSEIKKQFNTCELGKITLKGKTQPVGILSVEGIVPNS